MNKKTVYTLASLTGLGAACWLAYRARQATEDLPDFRTVEPGRIYAGGDPSNAGVRLLANQGIRCLVSLEHGLVQKNPAKVREEKRQAEQLGLHFVHVPMHRFLGPTLMELEEAVHEISLPANQPVYVHCNHGKERTNIVTGTWRVWIQGWPLEPAYAEMKRNGFKSIYRFWWNRFFSTWPASRQAQTTSV